MSERLNNLMSEWAKDAIIDETELGSHAILLAKLHSKYLNLLVQNNIKRNRLEVDYNNLKQLKSDYYNGFLEQDQLKELGWEPFALKLTKSGIEHKLSTDTELIDILLKKAEYDEYTESCKSILNEIKSMHYSIRAAIDWQRFINGG